MGDSVAEATWDIDFTFADIKLEDSRGIMLNSSDKFPNTGTVLDRKQIERILSLSSDLFAGIKEEDIGRYLTMGGVSMVKVGADTLLRQEHARQIDIGILVSGEAEIRQYDNQGTVFTVGILEPGDLFGEITAFIRGAGWPATVVTQTACEVLFLPVELITNPGNRNLGDITRQIMKNLLGIVAAKALNLRSRIEILTRNAMRSRIAVFLLQQANLEGKDSFTLSMNREGMSRYLNVSRPSMSRELGRMKEEGIINFHRSSFDILDRKSLLREAGIV